MLSAADSKATKRPSAEMEGSWLNSIALHASRADANAGGLAGLAVMDENIFVSVRIIWMGFGERYKGDKTAISGNVRVMAMCSCTPAELTLTTIGFSQNFF